MIITSTLKVKSYEHYTFCCYKEIMLNNFSINLEYCSLIISNWVRFEKMAIAP